MDDHFYYIGVSCFSVVICYSFIFSDKCFYLVFGYAKNLQTVAHEYYIIPNRFKIYIGQGYFLFKTFFHCLGRIDVAKTGVENNGIVGYGISEIFQSVDIFINEFAVGIGGGIQTQTT